MKKRIASFLILVFAFFSLPLHVSANGPVPAPWYSFYLKNLPEGTQYVDLLIYLPETDPMFVSLVPSNVPEGFSENAEIIRYCQDEYRSYTFHYSQALSVISPSSSPAEGYSKVVSFFTSGETIINDDTVRFSHAEEIESRGEIKLAMLDAEGNILKVSPPLSLQPKAFLSYSLGCFDYDGQTDHFEVDYAVSGLAHIAYFFVSLLGLIMTCLLEGLVSTCFNLDSQYSKLIRQTNIISQISMRLLFIPLYSLIFWRYSVAVLILEILVYGCEYLVYRKWMTDVSPRKCLLYTVCANTVSLIAGMILNVVTLF